MALVSDEMMLLPVSQPRRPVEQRETDGMRLLVPGSQCYISCGESLTGLWLNRELLLCVLATVAAFILEVTVPQQRRKSPWNLFYTLVWGGHWHKVIA